MDKKEAMKIAEREVISKAAYLGQLHSDWLETNKEGKDLLLALKTLIFVREQ